MISDAGANGHVAMRCAGRGIASHDDIAAVAAAVGEDVAVMVGAIGNPRGRDSSRRRTSAEGEVILRGESDGTTSHIFGR